jgi:hypothetical protein
LEIIKKEYKNKIKNIEAEAERKVEALKKDPIKVLGLEETIDKKSLVELKNKGIDEILKIGKRR